MYVTFVFLNIASLNEPKRTLLASFPAVLLKSMTIEFPLIASAVALIFVARAESLIPLYNGEFLPFAKFSLYSP